MAWLPRGSVVIEFEFCLMLFDGKRHGHNIPWHISCCARAAQNTIFSGVYLVFFISERVLNAHAMSGAMAQEWATVLCVASRVTDDSLPWHLGTVKRQSQSVWAALMHVSRANQSLNLAIDTVAEV